MFEIRNYLTLRWDLQPCCSDSSTFISYHTYKANSHKYPTCPYNRHLHEHDHMHLLYLFWTSKFPNEVDGTQNVKRTSNRKKETQIKTSLVNTVHSTPPCIKLISLCIPRQCKYHLDSGWDLEVWKAEESQLIILYVFV